MSRANVASVAARAVAWRNFAVFRLPFGGAGRLRGLGARLRRSTRHPSLLDDLAETKAAETIVRWAVPIAILVFLAIVVAISYDMVAREQDRTVVDATASLDLVASALAGEIDHRDKDVAPAEAAAHLLARLAPSEDRRQGQSILVSDQTGTLVASAPTSTVTTIAGMLGSAQPLTIFGEKAGVMRLVLPDGGEALATVRTLAAPLGQLAVIHRMDDVLAQWRSNLVRTMVLMACIGAVLGALAIAYFWQAGRSREADSTCRALRERFDMVLARGRCGLWDWDLASGHIDWSLSMFEIIGVLPRRKALSFAEVNAMIHPEDGGLAELSRRLSAAGGQTLDHVFRMRAASGAWVWLRAKAELVEGDGGSPHLVGIAIDVTETMALEARTAAADMRLRDAIETISEAFVVWDADNRLVMCNSKFQRFHNLPPEAVVAGTPYTRVMEHGTTPLIQSQVALGERQPLGARTFEAQLGDGRWLQINERRTKDGGYVSVGTDITALKRHEEQLLESESRLLRSVEDLKRSRQQLTGRSQELAELAEKLREQKAEAETANRAKSDFLANMSHELRTPLNAILGFSEVMMTEAFGPLGLPLYADYSRHIHTSGHCLNAVVTDVLEMAHLDSGRVRLEREEFVVGDAIATAVGSVAEIAAKAKVVVEGPRRTGATLYADRNAIVKILSILLNNAVKYTPAGGSVRVRTRTIGGTLELLVEDTGVGIPPEAIPRLGKPFEQVDRKLNNGMSGSGLGLAIARSLVELHGGEMSIASIHEAGTTVTVLLPDEIVMKAQLQIAANGVRPGGRPARYVPRSLGKLTRSA